MGILNSLHHPHVTKYLHAACRASELRIFMEFAEGGSLADEIKKHRALATRWDAGHSERPFQTSRVIKWMRQLTSALQHVHGAAVLHRDLKTANVFLSGADDVKLGDFGLSRALSTYTHFASTMVGTPYYMAPEVLDSSPYNHPADVWAVGIILFELLTLRRPFDGQHLGTLVVKISRGEYDDAALHGCPHPPALRRVASRECLLHPLPDRRMNLAELEASLAALSPPTSAAGAEPPPPPPAAAASASSDRRSSSDLRSSALPVVVELSSERSLRDPVESQHL